MLLRTCVSNSTMEGMAGHYTWLDGLRRFHAEFLGKLGCGPEEWLPIIHDAHSVGVRIVFLYEFTPYGLPIIAQKR
jgi:hypothetical protein